MDSNDVSPAAERALAEMQQCPNLPLIRDRSGKRLDNQSWCFPGSPQGRLGPGICTTRVLNLLVRAGLVVLFRNKVARLTDAGKVWKRRSVNSE
jgi:hypothetical protein